jgi:hypothetical protein
MISPLLAVLAVSGCTTASTPTAPVSTGSVTPPAAVPYDIDGDGVADSLTQRRVNGKWELTVVTASGTARHTFDSAGGPDDPEFVGIAPLDPVPGAEVIYSGPEEGLNYRVLTWRNGGLVAVPSPKGQPNWVTGDEFGEITGYAFSMKDGALKLVTSETGGEPDGTVSFVEYAWVSGAWAAQRTWTEVLSTEQEAWLCATFCGVTMVPLTRK